MSLSDVDDLRKHDCLELMEQLGEAQPRCGVLVVKVKAMIRDLFISENRKKEIVVISSDEQERAGGQGVPTPDTNIRESHDGKADQNNTERHHEAGNTEGSGHPAFGKHGAKT